MQQRTILSHLTHAVLSAVCIITTLAAGFIAVEPVVGRAVTDEFIVTQTVTSEISFVASTSDVVMSNAITSLTGGTSNGTTTVVVSTNDNDGYTLQIHFSSTTAMVRNGGNGVINNYAPAVGGVADFNFASEAFGQFAYTVTDNTNGGADLDPTFQDNGSTCGSGGGNTPYTCWFNPEPVGGIETIIDRTGATPAGGATTTLNFRVSVPPNPTPTIPDGTYTATATLTALTK
jgi:hypothetical protein